MILRVGVTGGIASGKSTVMRHLRELGCITVDADAIVARLYEPGNAGHAALIEAYGREILLPDERVDRKKLADIAFSDPAESRKLNAIIHPLVIAEQQRMMSEHEGDAIYAIEATLLIESGGRARFDKIVVVDVPPDIQIERAIGRGMTRDEAERRIAHQLPREERLRAADYVIDNRGGSDALERETRRVFELLRRDLNEKRRSA